MADDGKCSAACDGFFVHSMQANSYSPIANSYPLHRSYYRLISRRFADRIEITVVLQPVLVAPSLFDSPLERIETIIGATKQCKGAGDIVEKHRIFRIDGNRTRGERGRSFVVMNLCMRDGAKNARSRIIRIELEMLVDHLNLLPIGCICFVEPAKRCQALAKETWNLIIFGAKSCCTFVELHRFLMPALR